MLDGIGVSPLIWIVIPCYNEEAVLPLTAPVFLGQLKSLIDVGKIDDGSRVCFVNDGSSDDTWNLIENLSHQDPHFIGISLSRNRGHQNALFCGLMEARGNCDAAVSIDCDGQDDVTAIERMVDAYAQGYEVVYGVRSNRDSDTAFKRFTAESFYRLMSALGAETVFNHADYRLLGSAALDGLSEFHEVNLFLRGLVPLVGYPSTTVEYVRAERVAGESHYPLRKMLALAFDGITSLSTKPIQIISGVGIFFSLLGAISIIWAIVTQLTGGAVAGWASIVCFICFIGGLQLTALGIIGTYVGKIYLETKARPRYIVAHRTWGDKA